MHYEECLCVDFDVDFIYSLITFKQQKLFKHQQAAFFKWFPVSEITPAEPITFPFQSMTLVTIQPVGNRAATGENKHDAIVLT